MDVDFIGKKKKSTYGKKKKKYLSFKTRGFNLRSTFFTYKNREI